MKIYKRLSFMLTDTMKDICIINLEVKLLCVVEMYAKWQWICKTYLVGLASFSSTGLGESAHWNRDISHFSNFVYKLDVFGYVLLETWSISWLQILVCFWKFPHQTNVWCYLIQGDVFLAGSFMTMEIQGIIYHQHRRLLLDGAFFIKS